MVIAASTSVLFVCTGNLCRSVMAEGMLNSRAQAEGLDVSAASAGLATEGTAPPRAVLAVMRSRGIDVTAHRSRIVGPEMLDKASLVLGAGRIHAWEAVSLRPEHVGGVFTFRELVRLGTEVGPVRRNESLEQWVRRAHEHRRNLTPARVDDEIPDPLGRSRRFHERVAAEIEGLTESLVALLKGSPTAVAADQASSQGPQGSP